ncbi:MAG: hypothetical protein Q4C70_08570 [Planctomycetia bacterium]|nr:hypothetical protein [Planctomycetia bacterium]
MSSFGQKRRRLAGVGKVCEVKGGVDMEAWLNDITTILAFLCAIVFFLWDL